MQDLNNPLVAAMSAQASKKSTPLHKACAKGDEDQVRTLLEAGENIEAQDGDAMTPLQVAVQKNKLNVATLLVNRGADVEAQYKMWSGSQLPIYFAVMNKNEAMVRLLVDNGADIEARIQKGCGLTPLGVAAKEADGMENIVTYFLEKGAHTEAADTFRATPLYWATVYGHQGIIVKLLQFGASPNFRVRNGWETRVKRVLQTNPQIAQLLEQARRQNS